MSTMSYKTGTRFGVHGADSTGEIIRASHEGVTYRFDHAPEQVWGMSIKDFAKIAFAI